MTIIEMNVSNHRTIFQHILGELIHKFIFLESSIFHAIKQIFNSAITCYFCLLCLGEADQHFTVWSTQQKCFGYCWRDACYWRQCLNKKSKTGLPDLEIFKRWQKGNIFTRQHKLALRKGMQKVEPKLKHGIRESWIKLNGHGHKISLK